MKKDLVKIHGIYTKLSIQTMSNSIIKYSCLLILGGSLLSAGCSENKSEQTGNIKKMETKTNALFSKGEQGSNDYFVGTVWVTPLLSKDENNEYSIGNVIFEPGARANWHTHPKGQVLIVTDGTGIHQIEGEATQILKKGDVVNIPENTRHWHGASSDSQMTHIAITNYKDDVNVVWLEPVSEADYASANE